MRTRFRALGPVNLLAVDEYAKKKERWQFLTRQRTDLTSARAQLLEAIDKINVTASQMFRETFARVQGHFRDVFATPVRGRRLRAAHGRRRPARLRDRDRRQARAASTCRASA